MLSIAVSLICCWCLAFSAGQEQEDAASCRDYLLKWCAENKAPENNSLHVTAMNFMTSGSEMRRVFCIVDSQGTNCSRDGPWFSCSPDGTFSYKGAPVSQDSELEEACVASRFVKNHLENITFSEEELHQVMKDIQKEFWNEMLNLEKMFKEMRNSFHVFGNGFPFLSGPREVDKATDSSQVERE